MINRTEATIDLAALRHNWQQVKMLAPKSAILAMIKANAYGHGAVQIAKTLDKTEGFGVASCEEALQLRDAGIQQSIILMTGVRTAEELKFAEKWQLDTVVHHVSQLELLQKVSLSHPITVWLKIDTGMHRLGIPLSQAESVYQALMQLASVTKPIHLMTHLADADDIQKTTTQLQINDFKKVTANFSGPKSMANSAGILAWPETHQDFVRPGIMLYGVSPLLGQIGSAHQLQPVMTLTSRLIAVNQLRRGDHVGYGGTWTCPEDMSVGVVAIGYGDGYPRHAKNGTPVLINGVICPLAGRVSMDMITVDLRPLPTAKVGDVVTLWGEGLPAELVAKSAETIAYELFCNISSRVKFRMVNEDK